MIDSLFRTLFRLAYKVVSMYWRIVDPPRNGTLVGVWFNGRILITKNSYVDYFCIPGGYVKKGELPSVAAARELMEEVGITVPPSSLVPRPDLTPASEWGHKNHQISVFEVILKEPPDIEVDNREVVSAELLAPEVALRRTLYPLVRRMIEAHLDER